MVPLLWAVSRTTTALQFNGPDKMYMDAALSGFIFHLTAEETGVNAWYLNNSYAATKLLKANQGNVLRDALGLFWMPGGMGHLE